MTVSAFEGIDKKAKPERKLTEVLKKNAGRNSYGRITVRHHGGGNKQKYRIIDFKRDKTDMFATVLRLEYDPNRSAYIALVEYEDGERRYVIAPVGLTAGDKIISSASADIKPGNCLPIANIPVGTVIHNIEMHPGKGAQLVRSAGAAAQLMAKENGDAQIRMPSGEVRIVRTNCTACIGHAPEHKYPAGLDDCYEVTRLVFANAARYGIKKRNIILIGDSAGGNLAAAVSLRARDSHEFRVRRQILIYPATACEFGDDSPYLSMRQNGKGCLLTAERMRGYLDLYLNDISQKDDPYVSPIKAASLKGLPETLIITAENDPLRDEGEAFGKRLYNAGGNVRAFRIKNAYHGFFGTDLLRHPHAKEAVSIIMYFLRLTD
mgnify:CR=1 FL=1